MNDLKQCGLESIIIIDSNRNLKVPDYACVLPEDRLDGIDLIIVSVIDDYFKILEKFQDSWNTEIICMDDLAKDL